MKIISKFNSAIFGFALFLILSLMNTNALAATCGNVVGSVENLWGQDLAVSGLNAYVAHNNFSVVDISNATIPSIIGTYYMLDGAFIESCGICVSGYLAYVSGYHGFKIIDISNPRSPTPLGQIDVEEPYVWYKVDVKDTYAYVAMWNWSKGGFGIVDVSNPLSPNVVGFIQFNRASYGECGTYDVKVYGNYAYATFIGESGYSLLVIDVKDKYNPKVLSSVSLDSYPKRLFIANNKLYVATEYSFYIMNIDNPENPIIEGETHGFLPNVIEFGLYVSDTLAFFPISGTSIGVIDVRDSRNPKFVFEIPGLSNLGRGISVAGSFCYAGGFSIIDISTCKVEADKFVFPVLGISITDSLKNKNDPLQDGWAGKGVGQVSATVGHLGQDYYLKIGDSADKPVYAIAKGEVVEVMNGPGKYGWCDDSDHGWGPVVVIKHTSDNGFKVSDNAIIPLKNCGTDRNPKVIYSLYGHLSKESIKDITIGQTFNTGDLIGVIGKYGVDQASWTTNHLHFEIKDEAGFLEGSWYVSNSGQCPGTAAQSCGAQGIGTGYSHLANFAPHRYIPSVFIVENQGRKAHIQGVINLLMSD